MTKFTTLATALAVALTMSPVASMADDYPDVERDPLGLIDLDKKKCLFFPDKKDPSKYAQGFPIRVKFGRYGKDIKIKCFFPHNKDFEEDDGFKCVLAKDWRVFKRTYDSSFEPKGHVAFMKCDFEKHRYSGDL